ncbi:DNA/RNA nuclease SfsA [Thermopetrobacter sp. TC1]|uniref:DNA/RNA nuclease SfsA n=1 Tax=Thermopetrobacter sp. TC1 TaxID=1495045 RepID=UPI00056E7A53|nr:DNA/RNA nuclease SfsA [Thermopetrobacter sp. TC1]
MKLPKPMVPGRLVRRYKRFLADVILEDTGEQVTASTPNTGSMMGLLDAGNRVWLSVSDDPRRKYRYRWELVEVAGPAGHALVGLNTSLPNALAAEAIKAGIVPSIPADGEIRCEVRYGEENSRIDLLVQPKEAPPIYIEVKNVTLSRRPGLAEFPDAVTARGAKHLRELERIARAGKARAMMIYMVQRTDAEACALAADIDPAYMEAWKRATAAGMETVCLACCIDPGQIVANRVIPLEHS